MTSSYVIEFIANLLKKQRTKIGYAIHLEGNETDDMKSLAE